MDTLLYTILYTLLYTNPFHLKTLQIGLLVVRLLIPQFDDSHCIQRYFIKEYTAAITGGKTHGSGKIKQIQQILQSQWKSRIKGIKNKER